MFLFCSLFAIFIRIYYTPLMYFGAKVTIIFETN